MNNNMNNESRENIIKSQNNKLLNILNELSNDTKIQQNHSINIKEIINNEINRLNKYISKYFYSNSK